MKSVPKGLSQGEVEHIAWLARIELTEEDKKLFTQQFNTIIDYFHIIDELDTENIEPTLHVLDLSNVYRKDVIEDSLPINVVLANAKSKEKGYFKAPKII